MGIRGIPANYGGFETFAEEISTRLVLRGHEVWVYCRTNSIKYCGDEYRGVGLVRLPTIGTKYLDTPVHTLLSVAHSVSRRYDAVLMCNAANAVFCLVPRVSGARVALNVDGIERLRKKWGTAGRMWYRVGERLATRWPDLVISDAEVVRQYYLNAHGCESTMIPYGASTEPAASQEALRTLGVAPRRYVLYVSRLEPENNADVVIEAFARTRTDMRLVVVGDAPYATAYKESLKSLASADPRVVMPGGIFGLGYRELQSHAFCYVQATEVGGTHPALIESMALGNCVLANGTPENIEVLGGAGIVYQKNDVANLASNLQSLMDRPEAARRYRGAARRRAQEHYSWDACVEAYERALLAMIELDTRRSRE
jgi:glycosyltransferase involved in cell wall biosynthesis